MTQIKKILDKQGDEVFIRTSTKAVVDGNGYTAESRLQAMQDEINQAQLEVGAVPSDLTPTYGSTNWVTSGGVYNKFENYFVKTNSITYDSTETSKYIEDNTGTIKSATSAYTIAYLTLPKGKVRLRGYFNTHPVMWKYTYFNYATPESQIVGALDNDEIVVTIPSTGWYAICWMPGYSDSPSITTFETVDLFVTKELVDSVANLKGIEIKPSLVRGLYINENTGIVTANNSQCGSAYPVSAGEKIHVTGNGIGAYRYGFLNRYPVAGNTATEYGYSAIVELELVAPYNGYFYCSMADAYPNIQVYGDQPIICESVNMLLNNCRDVNGDVISSESSVTGLYINTSTGKIASENSQRGLMFRVEKSQVLKVDNISSAYLRMGFVLSSSISVGDDAYDYIATSSDEILTAPFNGYFYVSYSGAYPNIIVYNGKPVSQAVEEMQESKADRCYRFRYRMPNISTASLTVLSSATNNDGIVSISQGGSARSSFDMWEDEVKIAFRIIPTGSSFDVRYGRYATIAGTMFGLRKENGISYLDVYMVTTLVDSIELPFALLTDIEYFIVITKETFDYTSIRVEITSGDGKYYSYTHSGSAVFGSSDEGAGSTIGYLWGVFHFSATTGSLTVKDLTIYSPSKPLCHAAFLGHSYIEGNSIEGTKLSKFSKIAQIELGTDECGIFGHGGDTISSGLAVLQDYILPNYSPKYVFICEGANDTSITLATYQTWVNNVVSACSSGTIPVFFTIPPRDGEYKGNWQSINAWLRQSSYLVVDIDKCFVDSNGNVISSNMLSDGVHPTIATHKAIFNRILMDVPQLLQVNVIE